MSRAGRVLFHLLATAYGVPLHFGEIPALHVDNESSTPVGCKYCYRLPEPHDDLAARQEANRLSGELNAAWTDSASRKARYEVFRWWYNVSRGNCTVNSDLEEPGTLYAYGMESRTFPLVTETCYTSYTDEEGSHTWAFHEMHGWPSNLTAADMIVWREWTVESPPGFPLISAYFNGALSHADQDASAGPDHLHHSRHRLPTCRLTTIHRPSRRDGHVTHRHTPLSVAVVCGRPPLHPPLRPCRSHRSSDTVCASQIYLHHIHVKAPAQDAYQTTGLDFQVHGDTICIEEDGGAGTPHQRDPRAPTL